MTDAIIVTDRYRTPITAEKREQGGVVLRSPRSWIALNTAEFNRLVEFVCDGPRLGRLERFPATNERGDFLDHDR